MWILFFSIVIAVFAYKRYKTYKTNQDQYMQYLQSHVHHLQKTLEEEKKKQLEEVELLDIGARAGGTSGLVKEELLNSDEYDITYNGIRDDTTSDENAIIEEVMSEHTQPHTTKCFPDPLFELNITEVPIMLHDVAGISVSQNDPNSSVMASNSVSTVSTVPKSMDNCDYNLNSGGCDDDDDDDDDDIVDIVFVKDDGMGVGLPYSIEDLGVTETETETETEMVDDTSTLWGGLALVNTGDIDACGNSYNDDPSGDPGADLDTTPRKQSHCTYILKSGKRKGGMCNKKTSIYDRCKRHNR
jgi:hypothetical protein